ncbi:hypothetical protein N7485_012545 [Penicillium canescens]|nr:hypothetical protein N7485_012545 [Penicillium canescens]
MQWLNHPVGSNGSRLNGHRESLILGKVSVHTARRPQGSHLHELCHQFELPEHYPELSDTSARLPSGRQCSTSPIPTNHSPWERSREAKDVNAKLSPSAEMLFLEWSTLYSYLIA